MKRRSLLKAVFLGSALAFPAYKIRLQDESEETDMVEWIASVTGREVFIIEVGHSNLASGRDWYEG